LQQLSLSTDPGFLRAYTLPPPLRCGLCLSASLHFEFQIPRALASVPQRALSPAVSHCKAVAAHAHTTPCRTLLAVSLLPSPATIPAARVFFFAKAASALGGAGASRVPPSPSCAYLRFLLLPPRPAAASAVVLGEKGGRI
jgi:hypothetical protein